MNPLSGPRQQQQKQQQKQKTLRIKKQGNTLEFHSRLIEATEVRFSRYRAKSLAAEFAAADGKDVPQGLKALISASHVARLEPCPSFICSTRRSNTPTNCNGYVPSVCHWVVHDLEISARNNLPNAAAAHCNSSSRVKQSGQRRSHWPRASQMIPSRWSAVAKSIAFARRMARNAP